MELWQALRPLRALLPAAAATGSCFGSTAPGGATLLFRTAAGRGLGRRATGFGLRSPRGGPRGHDLVAAAEGGAPRAMAGAGEAYPATVFEQVHPAMGDRVRAFAARPRSAPWPADACGTSTPGIGETTAALARAGASVESVESDRRAVAEAESRGPTRAAPRRPGGGTSSASSRRPDLVITNPPRTGMDARIPDGARAPARPTASCTSRAIPPRSRAISRACQASAWPKSSAFDLFPQTAHVETVAVLDLPREVHRQRRSAARSRSRWTAIGSRSAGRTSSRA